MYVGTASIFAIVIIVILFSLPLLESKGLFLNSKVSNYYSQLKNIINKELNLQNTELLKIAVSHLSSQYTLFKNLSNPQDYTKDLILNSENYEVITSWCYLYIIFKLSESKFLEPDNSREIRKSTIVICKKNIEGKNIPSSFKEYFNYKN